MKGPASSATDTHWAGITQIGDGVPTRAVPVFVELTTSHGLMQSAVLPQTFVRTEMVKLKIFWVSNPSWCLQHPRCPEAAREGGKHFAARGGCFQVHFSGTRGSA